jgi:magnesium chelatase family protein
MLARRLATVLPAMSRGEALEVTQLHSIAGLLDGGLVRERPFRSPHHSVSLAALLGGGSGYLRPGEVSLAHHGVLFLDEVTEFRRDAIEGLRQPLEDGRVVVTRIAGTVEFPARFTLVAAANPCPCGFAGDDRCRCTEADHMRHARRLSGPLLDRIDILVDVHRPSADTLVGAAGQDSATIRATVVEARERQAARLEGTGALCNAQMDAKLVRDHARVEADGQAVLGTAYDQSGLSARGHERILKVARTVADLAGSDRVLAEHVHFAISLRAERRAAEVVA